MPRELLEEVKPDANDEIVFATFFEIYQQEGNFYTILDAYCRIWELTLDGEDISLLRQLWTTADKFYAQKRRDQQEKAKKSGGKSGGAGKPNIPHRPSRGRR